MSTGRTNSGWHAQTWSPAGTSGSHACVSPLIVDRSHQRETPVPPLGHLASCQHVPTGPHFCYLSWRQARATRWLSHSCYAQERLASRQGAQAPQGRLLTEDSFQTRVTSTRPVGVPDPCTSPPTRDLHMPHLTTLSPCH